MNSITAMVFSVLTLLSPRFDYKVGFTCANPTWDNPTVVDKVFKGSVSVSCEFTTPAVGDYARLADAYVAELKKTATVHSGPKETEFEGIPAVLFDATLPINEEGVESVRGDTYLATEGKEKFSAASFSKEIKASGLAANVIKMDNVARLKRGQKSNQHLLVITATTHVKKPGIVGVNQFKQLVMDKTEKKLKAKQGEIIEALASHM